MAWSAAPRACGSCGSGGRAAGDVGRPRPPPPAPGLRSRRLRARAAEARATSASRSSPARPAADPHATAGRPIRAGAPAAARRPPASPGEQEHEGVVQPGDEVAASRRGAPGATDLDQAHAVRTLQLGDDDRHRVADAARGREERVPGGAQALAVEQAGTSAGPGGVADGRLQRRPGAAGAQQRQDPEPAPVGEGRGERGRRGGQAEQAQRDRERRPPGSRSGHASSDVGVRLVSQDRHDRLIGRPGRALEGSRPPRSRVVLDQCAALAHWSPTGSGSPCSATAARSRRPPDREALP